MSNIVLQGVLLELFWEKVANGRGQKVLVKSAEVLEQGEHLVSLSTYL